MKLNILLLLFSVFTLNMIYPLASPREQTQPIDPSVKINQVWTEHNVMENGKMGMRIHVNLDMAGLKDKTCKVAAYFYHQSGTPVQDQGFRDTYYRTIDGNVSTYRNIATPYESATFPDITLFIPYEDFHLTGNFRLKYMISVFYHDLSLATSDFWEEFEFRTNIMYNYNINNQLRIGGWF